MGMDLKPIDPHEDCPRYKDGTYMYGRYNWAGWRWLIDFLTSHGVDVSCLSGCNDGEVIPEEKCKEIADCIEKHIDELPTGEDREWLRPHIALWRYCGGYEQW